MDFEKIDIRPLIKQYMEYLNRGQMGNNSDRKQQKNIVDSEKESINFFFKLIQGNQPFQFTQSREEINLLQNFKQSFHFPPSQQQFFNNNIEKAIKDEIKENSETVSLSLINDEQNLDFKNHLYWQQILEKYGDFFQPASFARTYLRANKLENILNGLKPFEVNQVQTKLYQGYNGRVNQWIVIKEQEAYRSLLETAQQYLIHNRIYNLYPQMFLQLLSPVYVEVDQFGKTKFISQLEYGEINLYNYSQLNKLEENEIQSIFQQLYQQIKLLHKHNIAHRDIKPQNIIFVENKGWVLCDFEDSIQYDKVIGIYCIRGTYAFLQAYLQIQSKNWGIMIEQNLLENDLYALAITLIVIKYQIKNQTEISQYLKENNGLEINTLLATPNFDSIDKIIIDQLPLYSKLKFNNIQKHQNIKEIDIYEFVGYISLLLNSTTQTIKLSEEVQAKLIDLIDCKLALKDDYYNILNLLCYVRIPSYLKYFNNLIKYQQLRQPKYWRNLLRNLDYSKHHQFILNQIKFMYYIGLTELTYKFAKFYLQNNYDFNVHIIIIRLLLHFNHKDQAQQELNQIFILGSFKQITQDELFELIELTLNNFSWDFISEEDIKYLEKLGTHVQYLEIPKILHEDISDQEFINKSVDNLNNILQFDFDQYSSGSILQYVEETLKIKCITVALLLIEKLTQTNLKYYCTTHHWQKLIQFQIDINHSLGIKQGLKKLTKKMNYIIIYNSEGVSQQQILKLIKLNTCINQIKNKVKQENLFKQLRNIIDIYEQRSLQYFQYIFIIEIMNILKEISINTYQDQCLFQYLYFMQRKQFFFDSLNEGDKAHFTIFLIILYQKTRNYRRFLKLSKNKDQLMMRQEVPVYPPGNLMKFFLLKKSYKRIQKIFVFNSYLERF